MTLGEQFDQIVAAARAGAPAAWDALYSDVSPIVLGYLRSRGARDPEDLLGTTFLDVVRGFPGFTGSERDLRAWILTIAHRRMIDDLRRQSRRVPEVAGEVPEEASGAVGGTEQEALDRVGTERVRALIGSLSPDQRDVLLLRLLGDMTIEEIAKALGKRPGAVKALQRRALAALRKKISEEGVPL